MIDDEEFLKMESEIENEFHGEDNVEELLLDKMQPGETQPDISQLDKMQLPAPQHYDSDDYSVPMKMNKDEQKVEKPQEKLVELSEDEEDETENEGECDGGEDKHGGDNVCEADKKTNYEYDKPKSWFVDEEMANNEGLEKIGTSFSNDQNDQLNEIINGHETLKADERVNQECPDIIEDLIYEDTNGEELPKKLTEIFDDENQLEAQESTNFKLAEDKPDFNSTEISQRSISIDKSINDLIDNAMSNIKIDYSLDNLDLEPTSTEKEEINDTFSKAASDTICVTNEKKEDNIESIQGEDQFELNADNQDSCNNMDNETMNEGHQIEKENIVNSEIANEEALSEETMKKKAEAIKEAFVNENEGNKIEVEQDASIKLLIDDFSKPSEVLKEFEKQQDDFLTSPEEEIKIVTDIIEAKDEEGEHEKFGIYDFGSEGVEDEELKDTNIYTKEMEIAEPLKRDALRKEDEAGAEFEKGEIIQNCKDEQAVDADAKIDCGTEENRIEETDQKVEISEVKRGTTKNLTGFWSSKTTKTTSTHVKSPIELPKEDSSSSCVENEPHRLEGVVRSAESSHDEITTIETGITKKLTHMFQNKRQQEKQKDLKLDINFSEPGVYENQPTQMQGVAKASVTGETVTIEKGITKSLAGRFMSPEEKNYRPKDALLYDYADGPSVCENKPASYAADVVKSYHNEELKVAEGTTKSLIQKWKDNNLDSKETCPKFADVRKILEAGKASESGVFENCPEQRQDVVREEDYEADVIPPNTTKSTMEIWNKISQQNNATDNNGITSNGISNNTTNNHSNNPSNIITAKVR